MSDAWNKCDICGKFISFDDFESGLSYRFCHPETEMGVENWETLCAKHNTYNKEGIANK